MGWVDKFKLVAMNDNSTTWGGMSLEERNHGDQQQHEEYGHNDHLQGNDDDEHGGHKDHRMVGQQRKK